MPDIDHEAIAHAIVIEHLSDDIEFCAVYEHEDADSWSEADCETIHGLACKQLRAIPGQLDAIVEPRRVATAADLDALKRGSVILLDYDVVLQAVLDWEAVEDPSCWRGVGEGAPILTSSQVIEAAGKGATITVLHAPAEVTA